ncbi:MAG: MMPL family transporter [Bacteroides sp.]|nr:MMPL family transporter [Prevotella sp.]MCM1408516.1 MMPL family transporter [Treponema brennaborense]MCM1469323.1 MMPL family transporter [Bacteroides sp.]
MKRSYFPHHPTVIAVCLLITAYFAFQLPKLSFDTGIRSFFPHNHPSYERSIRMEKLFGSDNLICIILETSASTLLTKQHIRMLRNITAKLEKIKYVRGVISLAGMDFISVDGTNGPITKLVPPDFSGEKEQIDEVLSRIGSWHELYGRMLLSDDGRSAQIIAAPISGLSGGQLQSLLNDIRETVNALLLPDTSAQFAGNPAADEMTQLCIRHDIAAVLPAAVLTVLLCLFFSFKTFCGTLLPFITVLMSSCWTVGIMTLCKIPFTPVSTLIPVAIIATGQAYGIHIINRFYGEMRSRETEIISGSGKTADIKCTAVLRAVSQTRNAIMLAGFTTMAGFTASVMNTLPALRNFAAFTAVGIFSAMIISVTFIPACLSVMPLEIRKTNKNIHRKNGTDTKNAAGTVFNSIKRALCGMRRFCCGTQKRTAAFCIAVGIISLCGIKYLRIENSFITYFPRNNSLRQTMEIMNTRFCGADSLYLIVSSTEKGGMADPAILTALDELRLYLDESNESIGKIISPATFIKRINESVQVFSGAAKSAKNAGKSNGSDSFCEIPSVPEKYGLTSMNELKKLITDYLSLFGGISDGFTDNSEAPSSMRMLIQLKTSGAAAVGRIISGAQLFAEQHFPDGYTIEYSGNAALEYDMTAMIIPNQLISLSFSLCCITFILAAAFKSIRAGIITSVPMLFSTALCCALMAAANLRLDLFTSFIPPLAAGVGIDYGIHVMASRRSEKRRQCMRNAAIQETSETSRSIMINSITVGAGFFALCLSDLAVLQKTGAVIAVIMQICALLTLTLLPELPKRHLPHS